MMQGSALSLLTRCMASWFHFVLVFVTLCFLLYCSWCSIVSSNFFFLDICIRLFIAVVLGFFLTLISEGRKCGGPADAFGSYGRTTLMSKWETWNDFCGWAVRLCHRIYIIFMPFKYYIAELSCDFFFFSILILTLNGVKMTYRLNLWFKHESNIAMLTVWTCKIRVDKLKLWLFEEYSTL